MNETPYEDRLVAAISHASILVPFFGIALPIVIWVSQKDRSPRLKFQVLQALVYQLAALAVYFLLMGCQMVGSIATFPLVVLPTALFENAPGGEINQAAAIIFFVLMGLICILGFLFNILLCVGGPVYFITGLFGAQRVLSGDDFFYPVIGRWLARRLSFDPSMYPSPERD